MTTTTKDDDESSWNRARALVGDAYAAITDDVFAACNDPDADLDTPFGPGQHVYGECVDTRRICAMMEVGPSDVLCDLGSGRGQVVLEAAVRSPPACARAVGVELVPARAALARAAHERLSSADHAASSSSASSVQSNAVLVEGDMFVNPEALDAFVDASCVFCANTAFAPGLNDLLANLLGDRFSSAGEGDGADGGGGGEGGEGAEKNMITSSASASASPPRMPRLRVAALTARLSTAAERAARLRLVRVGALAVSWHSAGTPVFIYRALGRDGDGDDDAVTGTETETGTGTGTGTPETGGERDAGTTKRQQHVVDPEADAMIEAMRAACAGLNGQGQFRALMRVSVFHSMIHDDAWQP